MNLQVSFTTEQKTRILYLSIPFIVLFVHLAIMVVTLPYQQFLTMTGLMFAYILPPAGKETVIPLGIALGLPWWYIALSIVLVDLETALFMTLNFDYVHRIPFIGPIIKDLTRKTHELIEHHHWLSGLYAFAIILMVMVPVLGSGGVRGSIAGRLLGMTPVQVLLAITIGSCIGCFGIALGSDQLLTYLCSNDHLPGELQGVMCAP